MYSISDLTTGAARIAQSVFGKKSEYQLQFNHEENGCWYIDFPGWPFEHHNLMMVAGADDLCAYMSNDDKTARVSVIPSNIEENHPGYCKLIQKEHGLTTGSTYDVTGLALSCYPLCLGTISQIHIYKENGLTKTRLK